MVLTKAPLMAGALVPVFCGLATGVKRQAGVGWLGVGAFRPRWRARRCRKSPLSGRGARTAPKHVSTAAGIIARMSAPGDAGVGDGGGRPGDDLPVMGVDDLLVMGTDDLPVMGTDDEGGAEALAVPACALAAVATPARARGHDDGLAVIGSPGPIARMPGRQRPMNPHDPADALVVGPRGWAPWLGPRGWAPVVGPWAGAAPPSPG